MRSQCDLPPFGNNRKDLQKSPSTTAIPPSIFFLSLFSLLNLCMSLRLLSSVSVQFLFAIRVSSHRIRQVFLSSSGREVPCLISHVFDLLISHLDLSFMLIGILNLECVVLPPQSRRAAIPHDATASTIFPSDCSFVMIFLYRYVLPVPPQPLTNIYFLSPLSTDSIIVSYVFLAQG